jgi:hypothetical protein
MTLVCHIANYGSASYLVASIPLFYDMYMYSSAAHYD